MIELTNVCKDYYLKDQTLSILRGINLCIKKNDFIGIVGKSGSGKSTLLNILGCLDNVTTGEYNFNGQSIINKNDNELTRIRNNDIGFIFQNFNLLSRLPAIDNVARPLIYQGIKSKERRTRAKILLQKLGLGNRLSHTPNQLSGGERQRVAIARALITNPAVILADEPTGNLDSQSSNDVMAIIKDLHSDGQTIILVTHDNEIAAECDKIIQVVDGKIV